MPGARFQQAHTGAYFKDAGEKKWTDVTKGLTGNYGFASAIHPRDPKTAYLFPLEFPMRMSPAATGAAVWRTRDRGKTWSKLANGLPRGSSYEVMREGMATDIAAYPDVPDATTLVPAPNGPIPGRACRASEAAC